MQKKNKVPSLPPFRSRPRFFPEQELGCGEKDSEGADVGQKRILLCDQNSPHRTKRKWSAQPSRHRFFWIFRSRPKIGGWGENNLAVPKSSMIFLAEHSFVYFVKIYTSLSKLYHVFVKVGTCIVYLAHLPNQTKLKFDRG